MKWGPQYSRIVMAVIVGIIIGIILSFIFNYWLWLPLMIGVCFIFSFWCKSATEIPEQEEEKF